MLYFLSAFILFLAESCSNIHGLASIRGHKQLSALTGSLSSALWCIKIIVIVNQPLTIITAFIGAYIGSLCAWSIQSKLDDKFNPSCSSTQQ